MYNLELRSGIDAFSRVPCEEEFSYLHPLTSSSVLHYCCFWVGSGKLRKGKGSGNPGKPGKRLRLQDLQSQFGVELKEAANRLGICPTTLKVCEPPLNTLP